MDPTMEHLLSLEIGSQCKIGNVLFSRVPGGWIARKSPVGGTHDVFVPFSKENYIIDCWDNLTWNEFYEVMGMLRR